MNTTRTSLKRLTVFDDVIDKDFPVLVGAEKRRIANYDQKGLSSSQCNIEPRVGKNHFYFVQKLISEERKDASTSGLVDREFIYGYNNHSEVSAFVRSIKYNFIKLLHCLSN